MSLGPTTAPAPLLHLITTVEWRAALAARVIAPPSLLDVGFVHLSTPEQVALPAGRIFRGRSDLLLLVLDPARIGVEVRFEPGLPTDPASMRFPHAYGPVPASAVLAVLPYRPRDDGGFDAPVLPSTDAAGRHAALEPSLLRRVATTEVPVTGGVAVLTEPYRASYHHNQLLIDGPTTAAQLIADADTALRTHGLVHRRASLFGGRHATIAADLTDRGWKVKHLIGMAAPAGGPRDERAEHLDLETLRPAWDTMWRREEPGIPDEERVQLTDRYRAEERVIDLRYLAVRIAGEVVAWCLLKIDGGTALLDAVMTHPGHRGHGHGDALVTEALALAGEAGCDLVVLDALDTDWPRRWYARRGFVEVTESWTVGIDR